jgi:membrane fusion protein, multidrug efflux system
MIRFEFQVILMVFLSAGSCRPENKPSETAEKAVPVITARATKVSSITELSLSGNIEGKRTVRLGFLVAGRINFIAVDEGQPVTKGQLLASLDPASYSIAKEIADAQVNQVQDEYDRLKIMYERNSLSESDSPRYPWDCSRPKHSKSYMPKIWRIRSYMCHLAVCC